MGLRASLGPQEEEEVKKQLALGEDEQAQGEQTLQQLAATSPQPEDSMAAYQRLSREAEEATPTEQDIMAAAMRRTRAQISADAPGYLQQAATTLFYKPDFSEQAAAAREQAKQPDMILSAKQQAQKRLEALAEGARKRVLLPGEMKEQESQVAMAQARMDALKEAAALKAKASAPASPEDIKKFNDTFGKIGASVPGDITKGELSQLWKDTSDLAVKRGTAFGAAERAAQAKKDVAGEKQKERETELIVPGVGVALTKEDAKLLKTQAAAKNRIEGGLDRISKEYSNLTDQDILKAPQTIQNIGTEAKDLIMAYKEYFRLGAPQSAELNFLYSMIGASPLEIGKTLVMDKTLGTNIQTKLNRLKSIAKEAWQEEVKLRTRSQEAPTEETPSPAQSKRRKATSADELP